MADRALEVWPSIVATVKVVEVFDFAITKEVRGRCKKIYYKTVTRS